MKDLVQGNRAIWEQQQLGLAAEGVGSELSTFFYFIIVPPPISLSSSIALIPHHLFLPPLPSQYQSIS